MRSGVDRWLFRVPESLTWHLDITYFQVKVVYLSKFAHNTYKVTAQGDNRGSR